MLFTEQIINNLRKIMNDRGLTQVVMAEFADTSPSQFSKILNGSVQLDEPVEAVLQIKLKKDKKDQVLKLVFGENNIEILNR